MISAYVPTCICRSMAREGKGTEGPTAQTVGEKEGRRLRVCVSACAVCVIHQLSLFLSGSFPNPFPNCNLYFTFSLPLIFSFPPFPLSPERVCVWVEAEVLRAEVPALLPFRSVGAGNGRHHLHMTGNITYMM